MVMLIKQIIIIINSNKLGLIKALLGEHKLQNANTLYYLIIIISM